MIALWLTIGLIMGSIGGWMLCALLTMAIHTDQLARLERQQYTIHQFLTHTEKYHDDPLLARLRAFARDLLEKGG